MSAALRDALWGLMGELPARDRPLAVECVGIEQREGYRLEHLRLDLNGLEPVNARFVAPLDAHGALPTVLYHHTHGGHYAQGCDELTEGHRHTDVAESWAHSLTRAGFAALSIDAWCFGARSHSTEHDTVKACLWQGRTLWGLMLYDAVRAVDYLATRSDVDATRIASVGMSMGSSMAWWLAAMDTRIKLCAEQCGLTDYAALLAQKSLSEHNFYYYVPGLLRLCNSPDILALIAPRPHLACVGSEDPKTPGFAQIDAHLRTAYAAAGAPQAWRLHVEPVGHRETPGMRDEVLRFLAAHL